MTKKKASQRSLPEEASEESPAIPLGTDFPTAPADPELPITDIPLEQIDLSANYRKTYDPVALNEFAASIAAVGFIISPVTLRMQANGRYQLVVGFRRYFGAQLAELKHIPGIVRDLTDEQVEEIQLQENIQREDPHPMHEAQAILRFYDRHLTTPDISLRLGKSVTWVYRRVKLCGLLPALQEMFLAGIFTLEQAHEIADLSPEAQATFFERYCSNWKERKPVFKMLSNVLASFKCELQTAIFDVRDGLLVATAGACTNCPFNTAYGGLLLPDPDAIGKCTRVACFENKTRTYLEQKVVRDLQTEEPVALIIDGEMPEVYRAVLDTIAGASALPVHQVEEITIIEQPEPPSLDEYRHDADEDENDYPQGSFETGDEDSPGGEDDASGIYQEDYDSAMEMYKEEQGEYAAAIGGARAMKGYFLSDTEARVVYYYPEPAGRRIAPVKTGQHIKDLIRAKKDTVDDLQEAIAHMKKREIRNKELDREKVQKAVHGELHKAAAAENAVFIITEEDKIATRWLLLDSVSYNMRNEVYHLLRIPADCARKPEALYEAVKNMSDAEFAVLVRMTLADKSDSKLPTTATGYFLRRVAESAGVDVAAIEEKQEKRAQVRQENAEVKIGLYKLRIKKHQGKRAA
jgi:ParB family chromosome partitioning protein